MPAMQLSDFDRVSLTLRESSLAVIGCLYQLMVSNTSAPSTARLPTAMCVTVALRMEDGTNATSNGTNQPEDSHDE
jgi:hypothetical protein